MVNLQDPSPNQCELNQISLDSIMLEYSNDVPKLANTGKFNSIAQHIEEETFNFNNEENALLTSMDAPASELQSLHFEIEEDSPFRSHIV